MAPAGPFRNQDFGLPMGKAFGRHNIN